VSGHGALSSVDGRRGRPAIRRIETAQRFSGVSTSLATSPTYSRRVRSQEDRDEVTLRIVRIVLASAVVMVLAAVLGWALDRFM
jgi:hypothetical protein